jgi:virginiamycin B lyase
MARSRSWSGALLLAALVGVSGCTGPEEDERAGPGPSPSPSDRAPVEYLENLGVHSIEAEPFPDWVTATESGVWVANVDPGLVRYDEDGAVTATVDTGDITLAMETGFGSLWAGADLGGGAAELVRVDIAAPESIVRIPVPPLASESSVAVTEAGVWVLTADGELLRVDPETNQVAATYPAPKWAAALRGGFGALWVTLATGRLARLHPVTAAVGTTIDVGREPVFLAIGSDAVWVMNQLDGSVSRVDPDAPRVTATVEGLGVIDGGDIAAVDGAVLVRTSDDLAVVVDPATARVVRRIGPPQGSGSIDLADDGSLWISAHDEFRVHRIPDLLAEPLALRSPLRH